MPDGATGDGISGQHDQWPPSVSSSMRATRRIVQPWREGVERHASAPSSATDDDGRRRILEFAKGDAARTSSWHVSGHRTGRHTPTATPFSTETTDPGDDKNTYDRDALDELRQSAAMAPHRRSVAVITHVGTPLSSATRDDADPDGPTASSTTTAPPYAVEPRTSPGRRCGVGAALTPADSAATARDLGCWGHRNGHRDPVFADTVTFVLAEIP